MIVELNKVFRKIKYTDKTHQYFLDDVSVKSVTQFLGSLKSYVDFNFWAYYHAVKASGYRARPYFRKDGTISTSGFMVDNQYYTVEEIQKLSMSVTFDDIKEQWKKEALIGSTRGTYVHNYLENLEKGIVDKPEVKILGLPLVQEIQYVRSIDLATEMCHQYLKDNQHLIPVAIEYRVGDKDLRLSGTLDRLYFNEESNKFEVYDFKTDKKIDTCNKYGNKMLLFDVDDCEFEKHSLQTSIYKYIIEKNLDVELGESMIVHFNIKEAKLEYFQANNYTKLIKEKSNEDDWSTYI